MRILHSWFLWNENPRKAESSRRESKPSLFLDFVFWEEIKQFLFFSKVDCFQDLFVSSLSMRFFEHPDLNLSKTSCFSAVPDRHLHHLHKKTANQVLFGKKGKRRSSKVRSILPFPLLLQCKKKIIISQLRQFFFVICFVGFLQRERREVGFLFLVLLDFRNSWLSDNLLRQGKGKGGLPRFFHFFVSVDLWLLFLWVFLFCSALFFSLLLDFSLWVGLFCGVFSAVEMWGGLFWKFCKRRRKLNFPPSLQQYAVS